MTRRSGAGGEDGRLPLRVFAPFLGWAAAFSAVQALVEQSAAVAAATRWLARLLVWFLNNVFGVAASADGPTVAFLATAQDVTPNCLGLSVMAVYGAAVLATPASWRSRGRAFAIGAVAISAVNAVRFLTFGALVRESMPAFRFAHVIAWGAFAPLILLAIWGAWAVHLPLPSGEGAGGKGAGVRGRSRQHELPAPRFPWRLLLRVAIALPLMLLAWQLGREGYLILVVSAVNALLTGAGLPVTAVSLVALDQFRFLDVAFADGAVRLEQASASVIPVAFLALVAATAAPVRRRLAVAAGGLIALFAYQVLGASAIIVLGRTAPGATLPVETLYDVLALAAPGALWLTFFPLRSASESGAARHSHGRPPAGSRRPLERASDKRVSAR